MIREDKVLLWVGSAPTGTTEPTMEETNPCGPAPTAAVPSVPGLDSACSDTAGTPWNRFQGCPATMTAPDQPLFTEPTR